MDVNVERADDVLTHKRLLELAHDPANRPSFAVRLVQVGSPSIRLTIFDCVMPYSILLVVTCLWLFGLLYF